MTAWVREISAAADPGLVGRVVRLAASAWVTPERIRQAVASVLARRTVDAHAVIDVLEREADDEHALAADERCVDVARSLQRLGATVAVVGQPGYPRRLLAAWPELGAPLWIFVRAPAAQLPEAPAVAVVGTRQPTLDGARTARELGRTLARHGVTVVSGMARGIDQAAHLGAIDAGGATVGVLGTGFGVDYPRRDGPVRDAVAAAGGLVTELLPGTQPRKHAFLWRNRIISALADVTVVVEGRQRSGALHTARLAAAQGREVMAVPGSVHAPASRAPLDLIRDGARPVTRLDDVLEAVGVNAAPAHEAASDAPVLQLGPVARELLPLLGDVPAAPGALAAASRQPLPSVMAAIAELTRSGVAASTPRGVVRATAAG